MKTLKKVNRRVSNKNKVKEEQDKERKVRRKLQREGIEPIKQVRKSERLKGKRMK